MTVLAETQLSMALAGLEALASRHVAGDEADGPEMKRIAQEVLDAIRALERQEVVVPDDTIDAGG